MVSQEHPNRLNGPARAWDGKMRGCILCAHGNDLPDGEYCRACGYLRDEWDDRIGPINGHNKSEALPNGCALFVAASFGFMMMLGAYGWIASALK